MLINPKELMVALGARLLSPPDAAAQSGINLPALYDILGDRKRRDEDGLVNIEPETARKLAKLLKEVPPILSLNIPSGPRKVPTDTRNMVATPTSLIEAHHRAQRRVT